jgi:hypothetical protein
MSRIVPLMTTRTFEPGQNPLALAKISLTTASSWCSVSGWRPLRM